MIRKNAFFLHGKTLTAGLFRPQQKIHAAAKISIHTAGQFRKIENALRRRTGVPAPQPWRRDGRKTTRNPGKSAAVQHYGLKRSASDRIISNWIFSAARNSADGRSPCDTSRPPRAPQPPAALSTASALGRRGPDRSRGCPGAANAGALGLSRRGGSPPPSRPLSPGRNADAPRPPRRPAAEPSRRIIRFPADRAGVLRAARPSPVGRPPPARACARAPSPRLSLGGTTAGNVGLFFSLPRAAKRPGGVVPVGPKRA